MIKDTCQNAQNNNRTMANVVVCIGYYDREAHGIRETRIGKFNRDRLDEFERFARNHKTPVSWYTAGTQETNFPEYGHNKAYERQLNELRKND